MSTFLILFLVADAIITVLVVSYVLKRRRSAQADPPEELAGMPSFGTFRALAAFAQQQHERIGNQVNANWSGSPGQLPGVLTRLLDELERDAKAQHLPVDRDVLKAMLAASLRSHRIGQGGEVREALSKVA